MSTAAPTETSFSASISSASGGHSENSADVCLLLEGTWPYVRGGVSTWVDQILNALPDTKFAVTFIGAERTSAGLAKYDAPPNLVAYQELFLFDPDEADEAAPSKRRAPAARANAAHKALRALLLPESSADSDAESDRRLNEAFACLSELADCVAFDGFWNHPSTWALLQEVYERYFDQISFIDFFWNARFLSQPAWRLLRLVNQLPAAAVYHSVSTGYAGLLGALASRQRPSSRFLLSEHGIYVRERISEILSTEWSAPADAGILGRNGTLTTAEGIDPLRRLWIDFFVEIGRFTYHSSAAIVSLFQRNAAIQVEFGAPADRIRVVPNGVDLDRFDPIRQARIEKRRENPNRTIIGFFGRVVAIKDVKTLLRAARQTINQLPSARFLVVGPTDEDTEYFEECQRLTTELNLDEFVHFSGPATPEQALPEFDVMVLSSVSEGLPFAILEAFATGIPVVSTDVGSCSELIHGRPEESPALGAAGTIVPVGDAAELGKALAALLADRSLQDQCGHTGLARARHYYAESSIINQYQELYSELARSSREAVSTA